MRCDNSSPGSRLAKRRWPGTAYAWRQDAQRAACTRPPGSRATPQDSLWTPWRPLRRHPNSCLRVRGSGRCPARPPNAPGRHVAGVPDPPRLAAAGTEAEKRKALGVRHPGGIVGVKEKSPPGARARMLTRRSRRKTSSSKARSLQGPTRQGVLLCGHHEARTRPRR